MNAALTVTDPLAEREVSIVITLTTGEQPRDERLALVSIGLAGQAPIIRGGVFGTTMDLIEEAWTAFGVQAQLAEQTAVAVVTDAAEIAAETTVAETPVLDGVTPLNETETTVASEGVADSPAHPSTAQPATPKPTASNLSLF